MQAFVIPLVVELKHSWNSPRVRWPDAGVRRHSGARLFGANPESSNTAARLDSGSAPKRRIPE
ncbi:MAG TPA: hypothetical protein VE865_03965 [Bradyrhizobium sp.]|jgi:hypothetical protein|nr:hypothetical protein [Bradyrhizobium sp.]